MKTDDGISLKRLDVNSLSPDEELTFIIKIFHI